LVWQAGKVINGIVDFLRRRHHVTDFDITSGSLQLNDGDRAVRVELPSKLLDEYAAQLTDDSIPGLSESPADLQDRIRAKHIALWIEELFESDLDKSLLQIHLSRNPDGSLFVDGRRGPDTRRVPPPFAEGGYWSSDPSGT
jgi:hypothetical protein